MGKIRALYFIMALTLWSMAAATPTTTSNELPKMARVPPPTTKPKEAPSPPPEASPKSNTSVAVQERTLYDDMMQLGRVYAPSLVDLVEFFQRENVWELIKAFIREWIAILIGSPPAEAKGQPQQEQGGRDAQALFTIPVVEYPVTRTQVEGLILDSLAVIKKWQTAKY